MNHDRNLQRFPCLLMKLLFHFALISAFAFRVGYADEPPKPILLLGLPRSGSESIYEFFRCMGFKASHYCCDGSNSHFPCRSRTCASCFQQSPHDLFHACGQYDVYAGFDEESQSPYSWFLPQHFALPLLHEQSGLWILNKRSSPKRWATNVLHWYSVTRRFFHAFNISYHYDIPDSSVSIAPQGETQSMTTLEYELELSLQRARNTTEHERRRQHLMDIYTRHTNTVIQFAKRHRHRLLVLDVDDTTTTTTAAQLLAQALAAEDDLAKVQRCWSFDAEALDRDWMNFTLPF